MQHQSIDLTQLTCERTLICTTDDRKFRWQIRPCGKYVGMGVLEYDEAMDGSILIHRLTIHPSVNPLVVGYVLADKVARLHSALFVWKVDSGSVMAAQVLPKMRQQLGLGAIIVE